MTDLHFDAFIIGLRIRVQFNFKYASERMIDIAAGPGPPDKSVFILLDGRKSARKQGLAIFTQQFQ